MISGMALSPGDWTSPGPSREPCSVTSSLLRPPKWRKSRRAAALSISTLAQRCAPTRCAPWLRILRHDRLEHVGDVLALVGGLLERFEDLLPVHELEPVTTLANQLRQGPTEHAVGLILQPVHLNGIRLDPREGV